MTLLPNDVREEFENLFHANLGTVRVHESAGVARLRTLAGARGEHIYVLPGVLERDDAREIVAHEVAHVLQQRTGRLRPGAEHDLEAEAMVPGPGDGGARGGTLVRRR